MKIPKYIVIRLDTKNHGTTVTATDISDRCEVIEQTEQTEPQDWKDQMWTEAVEDEPQNRCHRRPDTPCYLHPNKVKCGACRQWYSDEPQTDCACEKCKHFMTNDMGKIWCVGKRTCEKFEP